MQPIDPSNKCTVIITNSINWGDPTQDGDRVAMPLTATSGNPSGSAGFNEKTDSVDLRELPKNVSLGLTRCRGTLVNEMSTQQHVFDDIRVFCVGGEGVREAKRPLRHVQHPGLHLVQSLNAFLQVITLKS